MGEEDSSELLAGIAPAMLDRYERDDAVVYIVDKEGRLAWCNAAWDRFAEENGAPELTRASQIGARVASAICEDLREFYQNTFDRVRREKRELSHVYECSSPELLRLYQMRILPLADGPLLVIHSLVGGTRHGEASEGDAARYTDESGVVRMCAHCRRVRRPEGGGWDWVPGLVETLPENVTHGLCGFCRAYHYPEH